MAGPKRNPISPPGPGSDPELIRLQALVEESKQTLLAAIIDLDDLAGTLRAADDLEEVEDVAEDALLVADNLRELLNELEPPAPTKKVQKKRPRKKS